MNNPTAVAANGKVAETTAPPVTLESLQAQLAALLEENRQLRTRPVVNEGAAYGIIPPSADGKYGYSVKIALPHGGQLIGPRRKMVDISEEVTSGRLAAFLNAHPEVK